MDIFKAIRLRWRRWKIQQALRANARETIAANERIKRERERRMELTRKRIQIERQARNY